MIKFELVALAGVKFSGDVYEVILPTMTGQISVFADHMPLVSLAVPGVIKVRLKESDSDHQLEHFVTNGGAIEITGASVRVLVNDADQEAADNDAQAQAAFDRAQNLKNKAKEQVSINEAQGMMDRQSVRLHVAGLKRRRRR